MGYPALTSTHCVSLLSLGGTGGDKNIEECVTQDTEARHTGGCTFILIGVPAAEVLLLETRLIAEGGLS